MGRAWEVKPPPIDRRGRQAWLDRPPCLALTPRSSTSYYLPPRPGRRHQAELLGGGVAAALRRRRPRAGDRARGPWPAPRTSREPAQEPPRTCTRCPAGPRGALGAPTIRRPAMRAPGRLAVLVRPPCGHMLPVAFVDPRWAVQSGRCGPRRSMPLTPPTHGGKQLSNGVAPPAPPGRRPWPAASPSWSSCFREPAGDVFLRTGPEPGSRRPGPTRSGWPCPRPHHHRRRRRPAGNPGSGAEQGRHRGDPLLRQQSAELGPRVTPAWLVLAASALIACSPPGWPWPTGCLTDGDRPIKDWPGSRSGTRPPAPVERGGPAARRGRPEVPPRWPKPPSAWPSASGP